MSSIPTTLIGTVCPILYSQFLKTKAPDWIAEDLVEFLKPKSDDIAEGINQLQYADYRAAISHFQQGILSGRDVSFQKSLDKALEAFSVLPNTTAKLECAKLEACAHMSLFVLNGKTSREDISVLRSKLLRVLQQLNDEKELQLSLQECMGLRVRRARLPTVDENELVKNYILLCCQLSDFVTEQVSKLPVPAEALSFSPSPSGSSREPHNVSASTVKLNTTTETLWFSQNADTTADHDIHKPLYSLVSIEIKGSPITVLDAMISICNTNRDPEFKELLAHELDVLLQAARRQTGSLTPLKESAFKIFECVKKEQAVVTLIDREIAYIRQVENPPREEYREFVSVLLHEQIPRDELPVNARLKVNFVNTW